MACQLRNLPCTEIGEDFTCQFYAFFTQTMHFFIDVNIQFPSYSKPQSENPFSLPALQSGCSKSRKFKLRVFLY